MWWILEKTESEKFPYRIVIKDNDEIVLSLLVQERWPGGGKNIFCLRDVESEVQGEEIERVEIVSIRRYGKRMAVVLKRERNKRCEFLFLKKKYKNKEGEYEQIFWRTYQALRERRPKVKLKGYIDETIRVIIDVNERYPYKFPNATVERSKLPCGDYALINEEGEILAIVERKTFENFKREFLNLPLLHQSLGELETYKFSAVVVESNYSDFLNESKLKHYKPEFSAKIIAQIFVYHPNLTIIFAGSRKLAQEWVLRFFLAVKNYYLDKPHLEIKEKTSPYFSAKVITENYIKEKLNLLGEEFKFTDIKNLFPEVSPSTLRNFLNKMVKKGEILKKKIGKENLYQKTHLF